ncbi:pentapeptide repeat-containing protein [Shewanella intestini]|uniref:Pentapeptide repeat-containing protein n=1 Tax=Shewanella intestini TaxID=2017544 RepID=A0ABS5I007_9GAMM|nr:MULTISPECIES: pentapeptide repeat-containing protein [Shewanella]MBR9727367.1 pentapeptide repeat-containing protein [Shewanella intestini]
MQIEDNQYYYQQVFQGVSLSAATITHVEFECCQFIECDFSASTFRHCKFAQCQFQQVNLSLAKLPFSAFYEVSFTDSKLTGIDWTQADWPSLHNDPMLRFNQCLLTDSSFYGLVIQGSQFIDCKLKNVDFTDTDLTASSLQNSDLQYAQFMRTNLKQCNFTDAMNYHIDLHQNTITQATFSRFEALSLLEALSIELVD